MKALVSAVLLCVTMSGFAQSVGTVLFTSSKVTLVRGGVQQPLNRGDALREGDGIVTANDASVRFRYQNGTLVTLGNNSDYKISRYAPDQGNVQIESELRRGKLQSITAGQRGKREKLKTPMVTLGILGTTYHVYIPTSETLHVQVDEGRVEALKKLFLGGQSFIVTPAGVSEVPFPSAGQIDIPPAMEAIMTESVQDNLATQVEGSGGLEGLGSVANDVQFLTSTVVVAEDVATVTQTVATAILETAIIEIISCF